MEKDRRLKRKEDILYKKSYHAHHNESEPWNGNECFLFPDYLADASLNQSGIYWSCSCLFSPSLPVILYAFYNTWRKRSISSAIDIKGKYITYGNHSLLSKSWIMNAMWLITLLKMLLWQHWLIQQTRMHRVPNPSLELQLSEAKALFQEFSCSSSSDGGLRVHRVPQDDRTEWIGHYRTYVRNFIINIPLLAKNYPVKSEKTTILNGLQRTLVTFAEVIKVG